MEPTETATRALTVPAALDARAAAGAGEFLRLIHPEADDESAATGSCVDASDG